MIYFIVAGLLLLYFEIIGRWLFSKMKRKPMNFSFVLGFLFLMAVLYVISWPITAFNGSFYVLAALYLLIFALSVILVIKDIKEIDWHFDIKISVIFVLLLIFLLGISWNRTLGDPHGFDQLYYINMVSFNIGNLEMNSLHPHFGTYPNTDVQWITYVFQSYYYFIPVLIYIVRTALSVVGVSFETLPAFVWVFQILQSAIFVAAGLLTVQELKTKSKILNVAMIVLLILFLGGLYYNNALGFIGNNYRMSIHAIATLYLFRYFKNKEKTDLYLFYLSMLGMCAVSSTGTFSFVFVLFGLFFALYNKEDRLLKEFAIVLAIPLLNIAVTKLGAKFWVVLLVFAFVTIVYFLNDFILKLYQNKYIRYGTIILTSSIFIVASMLLTGDLINIHRFINNYSEVQDMSWDYFDFYDLKHWFFNLLVLIPMFFFLLKDRKHPFATISWVLILVFFNPLGSEFMNKINWVYYRSYDIIINQFTLMYFIAFLGEQLHFNIIYNVEILAISSFLAIVQIPTYWHETFIPDDDYNPLYKIENSELEVIQNVRRMIADKGIEDPAIITGTFYMPSFIEGSTYLIGKEKRYDYSSYDDNSFALYLIFFPSDYYDNFRPDAEPDYEHVTDYLDVCDYDILVVDYGQYVDYKGDFMSLVDVVEMDGKYQRSEYSTSKYAVYYLN